MFLPKPPAIGTINGHIPRIQPVPDGIHRPFWSVMIPTYNDGDYLRKTLHSVLCQALPPAEMQIEVVDGGSTHGDAESVTRDLGKGRISYFPLPVNRGSAHTFNKCIERSRGQWV